MAYRARMTQRLQFISAAKSVTGTVRLNNEDAFVVRPEFLAVADGVGGRPAGEVASAIAVAAVDSGLRRGLDLDAAVLLADEVVRSAALANSLLTTMCCTLTAAQLVGSVIRLAQVGDSRAYLARDGELTMLTIDQTMAQRLIDEGRSDELGKLRNPAALSQAIGGRSDDLTTKITEVEMTSGARLLLCTDGLSGYLPEADILRLMDPAVDLVPSAEGLVDAALEAGSRDNVTVIVAELTGPEI